MVVVGWRAGAGELVPVAVTNSVMASVQNTVQVTGQVTTERSTGAADSVVLVGWEERGQPVRAWQGVPAVRYRDAASGAADFYGPALSDARAVTAGRGGAASRNRW